MFDHHVFGRFGGHEKIQQRHRHRQSIPWIRLFRRTVLIRQFKFFGIPDLYKFFIAPLLNSGIISDKFGKVECFFFSAICFGIGLVLSLLVSLRSIGKSKNKDNGATDDGNEAERNPLSKN